MSNTLVVHTGDEVPLVDVNVIPVKIGYNGPANVNSHFTPSKHGSDAQYKACFHGRQLVGEEKCIKDYDAYVFHRSETLIRRVDGDDGDEYSDHIVDHQTVNTYSSVAKVNKYIVYGHDSLSSDVNWNKVGEWISTSEALHETN